MTRPWHTCSAAADRVLSVVLLFLLRAYRLLLSPWLGNCCRFHPSCSVYCMRAIEAHGCVKGLWLGLRRLCRCHPLHPGGVDLVPSPEPARTSEHPS